MVGDAGGMANMAAKLGAIYLAKEKDQDLAKAKVPPSATATSTSHSVTGKRNPVSNMTPGFGPPPVQTGPTSRVPKKAKVAPKRKKQILPATMVNQVKRSLPKEPEQELGLGLYDDVYKTQPLPMSSPGPQDPNQFLCLQTLLKSRSISVSRVLNSDQLPPVQDVVPAVEVPMEDQAFAVMDTLMEGGFSYKPPAGVDPEETQLNSLRAAGLITFSKVSASTVQDPLHDPLQDPLQVPTEVAMGSKMVLTEVPDENQLLQDVWD